MRQRGRECRRHPIDNDASDRLAGFYANGVRARKNRRQPIGEPFCDSITGFEFERRD